MPVAAIRVGRDIWLNAPNRRFYRANRRHGTAPAGLADGPEVGIAVFSKALVLARDRLRRLALRARYATR